MISFSGHIPHQSPSLYNYCLWPYEPCRPLTHHDQPALSVLLESFRCFGIERFGTELASNLLKLLGPNRTVFGIKSVEGAPCWEFYFYDYDPQNRRFSSRSIIQCFSSLVPASLCLDDGIPYFMFSLEITLEQIIASLPPTLTLYLGNPGGTLFGGKSYCVDSSSGFLLYQNSYHFYDYESHQEDISQHISSSLHVPGCFSGNLPFKRYPFFACQTFCIAHKRHCDGLYFSGVPLISLLQFFAAFNTHPFLSSFLSLNSSMYDYLLFDIGLDCQVKDTLHAFPKTAIYASF